MESEYRQNLETVYNRLSEQKREEIKKKFSILSKTILNSTTREMEFENLKSSIYEELSEHSTLQNYLANFELDKLERYQRHAEQSINLWDKTVTNLLEIK